MYSTLGAYPPVRREGEQCSLFSGIAKLLAFVLGDCDPLRILSPLCLMSLLSNVNTHVLVLFMAPYQLSPEAVTLLSSSPAQCLICLQ